MSVTLLYNNYLTIDLVENYQISKLLKQIDIYYHCIQELVYNKTFVLIYI
jgi:hypothetical protein